ncbi:MAG: gamma carbonic anhydrase family protein, partial [Bacteroidota bacterium]
MSIILPVKGVMPQIPSSCFIAPNATIVGDVVIGEDCSIWFNAVVRGDVNSIRIGNKVNIQDGA